MKLLIVTTLYPAGRTQMPGEIVRGKFVRDFANEWVRKGHEVHVLTPHSKNSLAFEELDGVYVHRFHYFIKDSWETLTHGYGIPENIKKFRNKLLVPFLYVAFWWKALTLVKNLKIEIINAHWAVPTGYVVLWIRPFVSAKFVTTVYGAELFPVIAGRMKILKPFIRKALNEADVVAGISKMTVDAAKELSGRHTIYVIPDGIDVEYYKPGPKNEGLLAKYKCGNEKTIFFTGRMVERKGHRYVLEAMKYVKKELSGVKLILGGQGPLFKELERLNDEWGLCDTVIMPGFIPEEDIVPLFQSVDVFVLPSCVDKNGDTEGSATIALEAMACGTPAIISKVGGNIGAVVHGKGAYYFEAENSHDLAQKILDILIKEDVAKQLSAAARPYVCANYSWSNVVDRYIKLINAL